MFEFVAPCLFGLEGPLSFELKAMGAENVMAENGRVRFFGGEDILVRSNLKSAFAERICICVGQAHTETFTQLFDAVNAMEWEKYIAKNDAFPVKGWSLNSALHSIPDCQKIIKKAIVERLKAKHKTNYLNETGPTINIRFSILKDKATLMIDTSGEGLHKRGYRKNSNEAPIKETLAAAMCHLTRIYDDTQLYDPFCGSGTILIEAAMQAANIAPGLHRRFAAETYPFIPKHIWRTEREKARAEINTDVPFRAFGSDIDPAAVELTLQNAKLAGVENLVSARVADIADFELPEGRATVITNPPYGERLGDESEAHKIYEIMGRVFPAAAGKRYGIITPQEDFERFFGRGTDKTRKLYNGMIKCNYNMYFRQVEEV